MVAINKILLPECAGEGCGGDTDVCTDSRVHRRNAEIRVPTTRNRCPTQPLVNNLYQGMALDAVTGLYYERNRNYSPTLGRWTSQDPLGYINGANTYQFVGSDPVGRADPGGTHVMLVGTGIADPSDIALKGAVNISGPLLEPWREVASYDLSMSFNNVNGKVLVGNETFHLHALAAGATRAGIAPTVNYVDDGKALLVTWHPVVSHGGAGAPGAIVGGVSMALAGTAFGQLAIPIPIFGFSIGFIVGAGVGAAFGYENTVELFPSYRAAIYAEWIVKPVGNCGVSIREIGSGGLVEYHFSISGPRNHIYFTRSSN